MTGTWRPVTLLACLVVASACTPGNTDVVASRSDQIRQIPETIPEPDPVPVAVPESESGQQSPISTPTTEPPGTDPAPSVSDPPPPGEPPVDAPLTPDEIDTLLAELAEGGFCDPDDVRDDGVVTAMHFVVHGQIQPPCYVAQPGDGDDVADVVIDDDPRLLEAWESLLAITPVELVSDISLLAGYEPCSSCDTLAFVTTLDEDATFFLLAVDVVSGEADPDELRLTMMHELSHVFAQKPGEQLDVSVLSAAGCDTFYNGAGCFTDGSYLWAWIQKFWPADLRDTLPRDGSVGTEDEAAERCSLDAGYTGSYAAVHPEEDFAETFSAYVYDVEVDAALAAKFAFFDQYPEFVLIRESAQELGFAGTPANFEGCG